MGSKAQMERLTVPRITPALTNPDLDPLGRKVSASTTLVL